MSSEHWIELTCHPSAQSEQARAIAVRVLRMVEELRITFRLDGNISGIRLPSPGPPRIGVELWRHTCFEAFISMDRKWEYHEINFSPSCEWTAYAFRSYRKGGPLADESICPRIAVHATRTRLELDATVRLGALSAFHMLAPLRLGLSAVIEGSDGFSYWALRHRRAEPDFHDAGGFSALLDSPIME
jgi:hypothetical protein